MGKTFEDALRDLVNEHINAGVTPTKQITADIEKVVRELLVPTQSAPADSNVGEAESDKKAE